MSGPRGRDRVGVLLGADQRITLSLEGEAEPLDLSDLAGPLVEIGLDGPRPAGVTDLRRRLGFWLEEVVRGKRLEVTVRGRPSVLIEPIAPTTRAGPPAAEGGPAG